MRSDLIDPMKYRMALAMIWIGLALQAFYYLSNIVISLGSHHIIFLIEAILGFCYILGLLLFILGIALIMISRFQGWNGWALVLKSVALIALFVSFLILVVAFYAIILMMPQGLWGTDQGSYSAWNLSFYGAIVSWFSYLTLFLLAYVLIFKVRHIKVLWPEPHRIHIEKGIKKS